MRNRQTCMVPDRLQVDVAPETEGAEDQIYRIYTADKQLCPTLKRWHDELRKDIPLYSIAH